MSANLALQSWFPSSMYHSKLKKNPNFEISETSISPFELQKADELFITNVISGIMSVSKYRKKEFSNNTTQQILNLLNADIRLVSNT